LPTIITRRRPSAFIGGLVLSALILGGCARADTVRARQAQLVLDCRGQLSSSPTVILESGLFGTSADWDSVLPDLAKGGRTCAYDRSGLGHSPPRTGGEDVDAIAQELAGMLDNMGEVGRVILVGHSNGALYVEAFAAKWPQRVAGLVYVNGVNSNDLDYPVLMQDLAHERRLADLAVAGAHLGLSPIVARILTGAAGLTGDAAERKRDALGSLAHLTAARDEDVAVIPGLTTVRGLGGAPPTVPLVVIVGATDPKSDLSRAWRAAGAAEIARAKSSWMLDALGATHTSPLTRDRAYVVAAVNWLRSAPPVGRKPETDAP
jgi:pimeloyl-ACP methyl ester carboxylesterase